jgi:sulfatase modifying factor 1
VLSAVPAALSNKNYQVAIKSISQYLGEIANAGIQDPQLQQMLAEAKGKESASIRNKKLVKLGIAAACVVVVLITGVVIKVNLDAKAVEIAVVEGNWETVLELDSDNAEGLRMKADAEKAAADKAAAKKAAADKAAAKKAAADKVARDKVAAERAAILAGDLIINTIGMTFNNIPAGTFTMGSPEGEEGRRDNETQHKVTITKAFYMQTTEVTQGQWMAVMGTEPWKGENFVQEGPGYAASWLNWDDAVAYCKKLSEIEDKTYRLPTEAEWEYACRAGTKTTWSFGDDEASLGDYAWYDSNAGDRGDKYAHKVGLKKPNAFGLYDMHGNVWEWVYDYFGEDYYKQSPEQEPQGPARGSSRVLRGGSWNHSTRYSRSAGRGWAGAVVRDRNGFRLVRELD